MTGTDSDLRAGISTFPRGLGELRDLEGLQADGCPLVPPYASIYAKNPLLLVALHDRERLALDLSDCGLDAVPTDLLQQTQLTSLNLGKNTIQVSATMISRRGFTSGCFCCKLEQPAVCTAAQLQIVLQVASPIQSNHICLTL